MTWSSTLLAIRALTTVGSLHPLAGRQRPTTNHEDPNLKTIFWSSGRIMTMVACLGNNVEAFSICGKSVTIPRLAQRLCEQVVSRSSEDLGQLFGASAQHCIFLMIWFDMWNGVILVPQCCWDFCWIGLDSLNSWAKVRRACPWGPHSIEATTSWVGV